MSQPGPSDRDPRWVSDSTFGIVRHVIVSGDLAAALNDLNSDYREVALVRQVS